MKVKIMCDNNNRLTYTGEDVLILIGDFSQSNIDNYLEVAQENVSVGTFTTNKDFESFFRDNMHVFNNDIFIIENVVFYGINVFNNDVLDIIQKSEYKMVIISERLPDNVMMNNIVKSDKIIAWCYPNDIGEQDYMYENTRFISKNEFIFTIETDKSPCNYSFTDLYKASNTNIPMNYVSLSQEDLNNKVIELCMTAKWYWKNVEIGGVVYTAFCPQKM